MLSVRSAALGVRSAVLSVRSPQEGVSGVCFWAMNQNQLFQAAREMQKHGGSFAHAIAEAFFCADSTNRATLVQAFKGLFEKYAKE